MSEMQMPHIVSNSLSCLNPLRFFMEWFRHDSNASRDTKLKKVRIRYGLEGVGLYWYLIEQIVDNINVNNMTFMLEDDAEIIANDLNMNQDHIQSMMLYMVDLGLFENNCGDITCMKIAKRLMQSQTSNPKMREMINKSHDAVMTMSDSVMKEKNRLERQEKTRKTREDKNNRSSNDDRFNEWWLQYPKKVGKKACLAIWKRRKLDSIADTLIADIIKRQASDSKWLDGFIPNPQTYLNGDRWEDEIEQGKQKCESLTDRYNRLIGESNEKTDIPTLTGRT
jgi:hypothetical protein